MKVIEKRELGTKRKRCINCESLLEYIKEDMRIYDSDYPFYYIKCPICGYKTRLTGSEIL